jgi:hypothetical protein
MGSSFSRLGLLARFWCARRRQALRVGSRWPGCRWSLAPGWRGPSIRPGRRAAWRGASRPRRAHHLPPRHRPTHAMELGHQPSVRAALSSTHRVCCRGAPGWGSDCGRCRRPGGSGVVHLVRLVHPLPVRLVHLFPVRLVHPPSGWMQCTVGAGWVTRCAARKGSGPMQRPARGCRPDEDEFAQLDCAVS